MRLPGPVPTYFLSHIFRIKQKFSLTAHNLPLGYYLDFSPAVQILLSVNYVSLSGVYNNNKEAPGVFVGADDHRFVRNACTAPGSSGSLKVPIKAILLNSPDRSGIKSTAFN